MNNYYNLDTHEFYKAITSQESISLTDDELYQAAMRRIRVLCHQHSIDEPTLALDLRGCTAGQVNTTKNHLRLNKTLFRENFGAFLTEVIPHELCHLWQRQLGLRERSHGAEWQRLMRRMGVEPKRTHSFDTARAKVRRIRRYPYKCVCRTHSLSAVIHHRISRGKTYRCRNCRSKLEYQPNLTI